MKNVLVMGLGGAGMNIATDIQKRLGYRAIAVNTDSIALKKCHLPRGLLMDATMSKGNGSKLPAGGRLAAENSRGELAYVLSKEAGLLVLVAGLGGGTGTGATPVIIELAKAMCLNVLVVVVLPFGFEKERREIALPALEELRSSEVSLLVYDNAALIAEMGGKSMSLPDMFAESSLRIAEDVEGFMGDILEVN